MKAYWWDLVAGVGLLLLGIGLWLWAAALALVVVGVLLLAGGVLGARAWSLDDLLSRARSNPAAAGKGAPGIKFVVSYGYSVAYATEAVLLPLKAVCRTAARLGF